MVNFPAAFAILPVASRSAASAVALSFEAMAASTFLIAVFTADFVDLLRSVLFRATRIRFFADLIFAKPFHLLPLKASYLDFNSPGGSCQPGFAVRIGPHCSGLHFGSGGRTVDTLAF